MWTRENLRLVALLWSALTFQYFRPSPYTHLTVGLLMIGIVLRKMRRYRQSK